jgi:Na+-translocating ferredoxin:NAD+ oxidoreductase RNF subunit RnfB
MAVALVDCELCTACEACIEACPTEAIALNDAGDCAVVDKELCTGCEACVEECPVEAISMVEDEE